MDGLRLAEIRIVETPAGGSGCVVQVDGVTLKNVAVLMKNVQVGDRFKALAYGKDPVHFFMWERVS